MPSILGANTLSSGYDVANSARFNSGDSAVLKRTHGTPTNAKKFVWSAWIKRSKLGADQYFVQNYTDGSNVSMAYFRSGDDIRIFDRHGTGDGTDTVWISDAKFRDTSAWMHFLLKVDTTQSTDSDRFQVYINGSLATGNGITYPALNADMNWTAASATNRHSIAATSDGYNYFGGYLCEVVLIDGTSPAHTDFGEFDEDSGIWKPKDVSGLTFGNNGYYLDFADSGDLGDDESGNGNDFAETNLAATDQSTDTCTNNFATLNPLTSFAGTFEEGNLKTTGSDDTVSTIGLTSGKWYWEAQRTNTSNQAHFGIGCSNGFFSATSVVSNGDYVYIRGDATYGTASRVGGITSIGSNGGTPATFTTGDILSFSLDLDSATKNITIKKNNGSTPLVDTDFSYDGSIPIFVYSRMNSGVGASFNFGNPATTISSGNTDGNGYGNFEYAVPSGYYALNTKNLAEYG